MESKPPMAPSADDKVTFSISDLAREFDITRARSASGRIRGCCSPRREGQTRVFSRRDRTRLKLALRGKRLGLSLARIKEMIEMCDTARDESSQLLRFLDVLAERRSAYERQREDIEAVLDEITGFEQVCRELLAQGGRRRRARGKIHVGWLTLT